MSLIEGLDIIPGLEQAFFSIFNLGNNSTENKILVQPRTVSRPKYSKLALRSLVVLWTPIYDGLTGTQKLAWTTYWESLPFGSHSGFHGWPGSGFSAFVYLNAPRLRAGLPLKLSPLPELGPEILFNAALIGSYHGWTLQGCVYIAGGVQVTADGGGTYDATITQNIGALQPGVFRIEVTCSIPNSLNPEVSSAPYDPVRKVLFAGLGTTGTPRYLGVGVDSNGNVAQTYGVDATLGNDPTKYFFRATVGADPDEGPILISGLSFKRYY